jgi:hypothetical protein
MKTARVAYAGAIQHATEHNGRLRLADGRIVAEDAVVWLPPVQPGTIFALGLNYADHAKELAFKAPDELHIGAFAGHGERQAHAARGWSGKSERRASRVNGKRQAGVERNREFRLSWKNRGVRAVFQQQRKWFTAVTRVEDSEAGCQRDFCFVGGQRFPFKL